MKIEHRLQHAARELREVHIDVPPLGSRRTTVRRPRLTALAAPMLFVAGGLFALGTARADLNVPMQSDIGGRPAATIVPAPSDDAEHAIDATQMVAPSVRVELEMIAEIISRNRSAVDTDVPVASSTSEAVAPNGPGPS